MKLLKSAIGLLAFAMLILWGATGFAQKPTTWYIRHDGGTNTQCTGTTNAPYPGLGTAQPCAYNHPYWLQTYSGAWAALASGDTIQFTDPTSNTTPYYMGEQNGGLGYDWGGSGEGGPLGGICPHPNAGHAAGASCAMPPFPNNVTIHGQNSGSCHTAGHTGLVNPTILSGISGIWNVLNFQGTSGDSADCILITQPDNCTSAGIGSGGGCGDLANYIQSAGINFEYGTAQGPRNLTLTDIAVDGTAGYGIIGSHLNTLSTDVISLSDVYLEGNGGAGYNSDGGGCGTSCESVGTLNVTNMRVEGNGCLLLKPFNPSLILTAQPNGFSYCFGQNTGGYGDGFVLIAAGASTVNVSHSFFLYNTQDGFDGLHISDDITTSPNLNITDSWSEGNAGQAIKIGVGGTSTAINNVTIANCHVLDQSATFPNNPSGWITLDAGDTCRAAGNQWAFQMKNGSVLTLANNTILGYGTTMFDFGCAYGASTCGTGGTIATETNDLHLGFPDPANAGRLASGWYIETGLTTSNIVADHNLWYNMNTGCPDNGLVGETNYVCGDPQLTSESNIDAIVPTISSTSPAVRAGITISGITTDFLGNPQTSPPTIGALTYLGATGGTVIRGNVVQRGLVIH